MKSNDENFDDLLKSMEDFDVEDNGKEEDKPLSALEKLMAEMQSEEEGGFSGNEEEGMLTEEGIGMLLDNAKNSALEENNSEAASNAADFDVSEIEALLDMTDSTGIADQKSEASSLYESQGIEEVYVEEEVMELDPAELDAILSVDSQSGEAAQTNKSDSQKKIFLGGGIFKTDEKAQPKEKKKKSGGFFSKLFSILMEEIPDDEPEEAGTLNLSQENKDILNDLDKEKAKKSKKKDKKSKRGKGKEEGKEKKPKKEKKAKPKKEKKPKEEKVAFKPEKRLPRKKVIVTFVFAFSVLACILVIVYVFPPAVSISTAREAFNKGDYKVAYQEYYGKKLSEEDETKFQGAKTILRMQSSLDGYTSYHAIDNEVMALHSLLEGVHIKGDVSEKAELYGVSSQVQRVYNEILGILESGFGLTEAQAVQLLSEKSDVVYTNQLNAIAIGEEVIIEEAVESEESTEPVEEAQEEVVEEISQEDLLPEELEIIEGE